MAADYIQAQKHVVPVVDRLCQRHHVELVGLRLLGLFRIEQVVRWRDLEATVGDNDTLKS